MWDGGDIEDDTDSLDPVPDPDQRVGIEIMGLYDTGTNLLNALLHVNFWNQFTTYGMVPPNTMQGVWKHANPNSLIDQNISELSLIANENVAVLAMIRDPLSWFQSLHKAPYSLIGCVTGDDWLTKPCVHGSPAGPNSSTQTWANLADMWADWTQSYTRLKEAGVERVLTIRYEDLVLQPENVLSEIATLLNLDMPASFKTVDDAAKASGGALGRQEAIDKITGKTYLAGYTGVTWHSACSSLAKWRPLLEEHLYDGCPESLESQSLRRRLKRHLHHK